MVKDIKRMWWLNTTDACGAIITGASGKVIVGAIDVYKWMRGKRVNYVIDTLKRKGTFIELKELDNN